MTEKDRHTIITDTELRKILDEYAEASLGALEERAPDELESRLDSVISAMGARSRRRRLWFSCAAAAAVALVVTAAIGVVSRPVAIGGDSVTAQADSPLDDTGSIIPDLPSLPSVVPSDGTLASSSSDEVSPLAATVPPAVSIAAETAVSTAGRSSRNIASAHRKSLRASSEALTRPDVSQKNAEQPHATENGEKIADLIPSVSLAPQLMLSAAVPENLLPTDASPLASAPEMNMVRESLDKVNAVFYQARKTVSTLSEDVMYAASSPLRSI